MVSPVKSKMLAIAPKFTAFLSICGSLGIVLQVLFDAGRRKKTVHRIMVGMSICDILATIWYFVGTWAIPKETISRFGDGDTEKIFWAAGDENGISCSFAGFFNQFAVATPIYNTTLATYFLLVIFHGWSDNRILKIEWLLHTIPLGYALIASIFAVAADLYGHVEWTCWILPEETYDETQELTPIQSKFQIIQWIFLFGIIWACVIFETITFVLLYRKMRSLEQLMSKYTYKKTSFSESESSSSSFSRTSNIKRNCSSRGGFSIRQMSENLTVEQEPHSDLKEEEASRSDIELEINRVSSDNDEGIVQNLSDKSLEGINHGADSTKGYTAGHAITKESIEKEPNDSIQLSCVKEEEQKGTADATCKISIEPFMRRNLANDVKKEISTSSLISSSPAQRADQHFTNRDAENLPSMPRRVRRQVTKSRRIAIQGLLYVGAFYITWLFPTITRITELAAGKNYFPIQFLDTFLLPLQGFINFCIYIRPDFLEHQKRNTEDGFWKSIKAVVFQNRV